MDMDAERVQIGSQPTGIRAVYIDLTDPDLLLVLGRRMMQGHVLDAREISAQAHEAVT